MNKQTQSPAVIVGAIAGGAGFVAFAALMGLGGYAFTPAVFLGLVIGIIVAVALLLGFMGRDDPAGKTAHRQMPAAAHDGPQGDRPMPGATDISRPATATAMATGAATATAGVAGARLPADDPAARRAEAAAGKDTVGTAPVAGTSGRPPAAAREDSPMERSGAVPTPEPRAPLPEAHAHDEPDPATEAAMPATDPSAADRPARSAADATGALGEEAAPEAGVAESGEPDRDPSAGAAPARPDAPKWTASQLKGEQDLASRKGSWRYDTGASGRGPAESAPAEAPAEAPSAPEAPPASVAPASQAPAGEDIVDIGTEPRRLSEPREDGADDLKRIKGVGPKLEAMLNRMGFYHFDQISDWTEQEVAWVDENLKGFKGRVSRDNWVSQAAILAEGGETDFSRRVGGGELY